MILVSADKSATSFASSKVLHVVSWYQGSSFNPMFSSEDLIVFGKVMAAIEIILWSKLGVVTQNSPTVMSLVDFLELHMHMHNNLVDLASL